MPLFVKTLFHKAAKTYTKHRLHVYAAAISFFCLFSVPALLLLVIALARVVARQSMVTNLMVNTLTELFGSQIALKYTTIVTNALTSRSGGISGWLFGMLVIFSAASALRFFQQAVRDLFVPKKERKQLSRQGHLLRYASTLGHVVLISLAVVVLSSLQGVWILGSGYINELLPVTLGAPIRWFLLTSTLSWILFVLVLWLVLPSRLERKGVLVMRSSLLLLVLLLPIKYLMELYVLHSATISLYGTASFVVILLIWIYYFVSSVFAVLCLEKVYRSRH